MSDVDVSRRGVSRRGLAPRGSLATLIGIVVSGVSGYGTLVLVTRLVERDAQPALAATWTLVFLVGPAVFFPVEQALAGRLLRGETAASAVRVSVALALILTAGTLAAGPVILDELLDGRGWLLVALVASYVGYACQHVVRARLVASGSFSRYALVIALDGALRLAGCLALAAFGARSAEAFTLVLGIAPLLAAVAGGRATTVPPRAAAVPAARLGREVTQLLVGSLCGQVVLAAGPAVLKLLVEDDPDVVPAYLVASSLTRVPLLLGQALLAPLLAGVAATLRPGAAAGEYARLLRRTGLLVGLGGAAATIVFAALGPWAIRLVFGDRFVVSGGVLAALCGCAMAYLAGQLLTQALVARGRGGVAAAGWAAGLAVFGVVLVAVPGTVGRVLAATACGCAAALLALTPSAAHPPPPHS